MIGAGCGDQSLVQCDKDSSSKQCVEKTDDEKAVIALNEGRFQDAIDILEPLIKAESKKYYRYPRLAAAYASLAGIDLLEAATSQSNADQGNEESGALGAFDGFIPPYKAEKRAQYKVKTDLVQKAFEIIDQMPERQKQASKQYYYGASAEFQLFLYRMMFSAMSLKLYAVPEATSGSELNQEYLEEMIEDGQGAVIVEALADASIDAADGFGSEGEGVDAEELSSLVDEIKATEGADLNEKLKNFLILEQAKDQDPEQLQNQGQN